MRRRLLLLAGVCALAAAGVVAPLASTSPGSGAVSCKRGQKRATIGGAVTCLRVGAPCKARFQRAYLRNGFTCVSGHLKRKPPATPGQYAGRTSQNETFAFTVVGGGRTVVNLKTGQINQSCTPNGSVYGGNLSLPGSIPIRRDGSFSYAAGPYATTVGSNAAQRKDAIDGRFTAGAATGTMRVLTTFTDQGTSYSCDSGPITWNASKTR